MDPKGAVAGRFPLVARPRPACIPLPDRVDDLCRRAGAAAHHNDAAGAVSVFNLAALLASDCGLPDLARQWSIRLAHMMLLRSPHDFRGASHSVEPIVNLARLRTRAGDGFGAWSILEKLYRSVALRSDASIDGIEVPASRLADTDESHRELCEWLWAVLLSSGARALAVAGRWEDAHRRLDRHRGIGDRLLDGRQIAVIANATAGRRDVALALLRETASGEPWEGAVAACLTLLCQPHGLANVGEKEAAVALCRALDTTGAGLVVFHTRLGLSLVDALGGADHPLTEPILADLASRASTDGYAARDLLAHSDCRRMLTRQYVVRLATLVDACGLDIGSMPDPLLTRLSGALDTAERVIILVIPSASPPDVSNGQSAISSGDERG